MRGREAFLDLEGEEGVVIHILQNPLSAMVWFLVCLHSYCLRLHG